jgi:hypothetical protein
MYDIKNAIVNPTVVKTQQVNSFDMAEIEKNTQPKESRDGLAIKLHALDIALQQPACCDKEFLKAMREYLRAIRSTVQELETIQYEKIRLVKEKRIEFEQYQQEQMAEYYQVDKKIEDMLRVVHMSHIGAVFDKLVPLNGLWCIKTNILVAMICECSSKMDMAPEMSMSSSYVSWSI